MLLRISMDTDLDVPGLPQMNKGILAWMHCTMMYRFSFSGPFTAISSGILLRRFNFSRYSEDLVSKSAWILEHFSELVCVSSTLPRSLSLLVMLSLKTFASVLISIFMFLVPCCRMEKPQ